MYYLQTLRDGIWADLVHWRAEDARWPYGAEPDGRGGHAHRTLSGAVQELVQAYAELYLSASLGAPFEENERLLVIPFVHEIRIIRREARCEDVVAMSFVDHEGGA